MSHGHEFWWLLMWACVVWYSTITVYIAIRGRRDVKEMLARLKRDHEDENRRSAREDATTSSAPPTTPSPPQ